MKGNRICVSDATEEQLRLILKHLPCEITFVDESDSIRFFTQLDPPLFVRKPEIIGASVVDCHGDSKEIVRELL